MEHLPKPDLVSVIERMCPDINHIEYGKSIKCPFHKDDTPSLMIYEDEHFFCFGCNKHGDVYDFAGYLTYGDLWDCRNAEMFLEVKKYLQGEKYPVYYTRKKEEKEQPSSLSKEQIAVLKWAANCYHQNLKSGMGEDVQKARQFLYGRGFSDHIIDKLKIGYAGKGTLHKKSLLLESERQEKCIGVLKEMNFVIGENEFYKNRIIFPNITSDGDVLNLTGRYLSSKTKNDKRKRYLNMKKLPRHLYLSGISDPNELTILTESITDTVTLRQLGFQAIATNGTNMTKGMVNEIKGFTNILILPQNDVPSWNAAKKWSEMLPEARIAEVDYEQGTKDINDIFVRLGFGKTKSIVNIALRRSMTIEAFLADVFSAE